MVVAPRRATCPLVAWRGVNGQQARTTRGADHSATVSVSVSVSVLVPVPVPVSVSVRACVCSRTQAKKPNQTGINAFQIEFFDNSEAGPPKRWQLLWACTRCSRWPLLSWGLLPEEPRVQGVSCRAAWCAALRAARAHTLGSLLNNALAVHPYLATWVGGYPGADGGCRPRVRADPALTLR